MPHKRLFNVLTTLFLGLLLVPASAQTTRTGRLMHATSGKPVPYATVEIEGKGVGTVALEDGTFELELTSDFANDTLSIRNLGFHNRRVPVADWLAKETIVLQPRVYELREVEIVENTSDSPGRLGFTDDGPNTSTYGMAQWTQIAVYMATPRHTEGFLTNVQFYVPRDAKHDAPFRVRLYTCTTDGRPGEDMLEYDILAKANNGDEWVTADLRTLGIEMPRNGFFVAMEWINSGKSYRYTEKVNGQKNTFYGQKLGSKIGQEKPLTWIRQVGTAWRQDDKQIGGGYRNAMIRAEFITR